MDNTFIGKQIRKFRKEKKWTQKQLGTACGIHEANIRKYELGTQNPKKETLKKIADALDISLIDLGMITPDFKEAISQLEDSGVKRFLSDASHEEIKINELLDDLNEKGQKKVLSYAEDLAKIPEYRKSKNNISTLNAAHARTEITPTPEGQAHDNAIMDDDSEWK